MPGRPKLLVRITVKGFAIGTYATIALGWSFWQDIRLTILAGTWISSVGRFCQLAAGMAYEYILGVSRIPGQQVAREQIDVLTTFTTLQPLNPQEILYGRVICTA